MKVKIENRYLGLAANLLFSLSLKGKQSRHRTKFIKLLNDRLREVEEQRIELAKEFAVKDEEGKPIVKDEAYEIADMLAFTKEVEELYSEEMVIEGGDYQGMLKTVKDVLLNCDVAFSGQDAIIYDYLCEQFEGGEAE